MLLVSLSVIATALAVGFGVAAYLADRKAGPADTWSVGPRTRAMNQADRMLGGAQRDRRRHTSRAFTYAGAARWLCASAFAAASALIGTPVPSSVSASASPSALPSVSATASVSVSVTASAVQSATPASSPVLGYIFTGLAIALAIIAIVFLAVSTVGNNRRFADQLTRIAEVRRLLALAIDPERPPLSVVDQLQEWASNSDLLVYLQHRVGSSPLSPTYQGRLVFQTTGIGGYVFYAPDWHLSPLDSVSVVRGMALNLHAWLDPTWRAGNGKVGARCHFMRRGDVAMRGNHGAAIINTAIVEQFSLMIDDPFETMPFLESNDGA
jgi:hypothetical protein